MYFTNVNTINVNTEDDELVSMHDRFTLVWLYRCVLTSLGAAWQWVVRTYQVHVHRQSGVPSLRDIRIWHADGAQLV